MLLYNFPRKDPGSIKQYSIENIDEDRREILCENFLTVLEDLLKSLVGCIKNKNWNNYLITSA